MVGSRRTLYSNQTNEVGFVTHYASQEGDDDDDCITAKKYKKLALYIDE